MDLGGGVPGPLVDAKDAGCSAAPPHRDRRRDPRPQRRHIEEYLAAVTERAAEPGSASVHAIPVPDTLADAVVAKIVPVAHLLGEGLASRVRRLELALGSIPRLAGTESVRAALLSSLAAAYMLDRRLEESISYGEQGYQLGEAIGDETTTLNTAARLLTTVGATGPRTRGTR